MDYIKSAPMLKYSMLPMYYVIEPTYFLEALKTV